MASTFDTVAFDRGTNPILVFFNAEQARTLVAYRGDEALRSRLDRKPKSSFHLIIAIVEHLGICGHPALRP